MQLISEQKEVCLFLSQLKTILQSPKFNLDTDLDILMTLYLQLVTIFFLFASLMLIQLE